MFVIEIIIMNLCILGIDFFVVGGIGEEDFCILVLLYIYSVKEGVICLGVLFE